MPIMRLEEILIIFIGSLCGGVFIEGDFLFFKSGLKSFGMTLTPLDVCRRRIDESS